MEATITDIQHHLTTEVGRFEPVLSKYGVFIILVVVAVEGFGIPAPGQTLMIAAAILSARGHANIYAVILAAWSAAVGGSIIGYAIGRIGGRKLLQRLPVSANRLGRMEEICRRYGSLLIVGARFFDGLRQFSSMFVGSLNMPPLTFLLMTALGATLWVGFWGLGVYYLDQHIHAIAAAFRQLSPYTWAMAGVLIAVVLLYLFGVGKKTD